MSKILREPSTWAGISGIIAALSAYFTQDLNIQTAIAMGMGSVAAVFLPEGKK